MTIVCGDNYAVENQDQVTAAVLDKVRTSGADLFAAGPCFDAGRYGMAAGAICTAIQGELGIPAITAMHVENPGVDLFREQLHIVDSGNSIAKMRDIVATMAKLGKKLVAKQPIGLPAEEGYISRGLLRDQLGDKTAATRMIDMLIAKMNGEKFDSEMLPNAFAPVPMPARIEDMSKARLMIITDGGLVPKGNPDKIREAPRRRVGASYSIEGCDDLRSEEYEVSHGGYDTTVALHGRSRPFGAPSTPCASWKKSGVDRRAARGVSSATCGRVEPTHRTPADMGREMAAEGQAMTASTR